MNNKEIKEKLEDVVESGTEKFVKFSLSLDKEPLLDRIMGKAISRKFLTFGVATGLMLNANLDSETWGMIAMIYIGSQSVIDACLAWRHGR